MNKLAVKIILSIVLLTIALLIAYFINLRQQATSNGLFHLIIMDQSETIVFDEDIEFLEGETFYDVLSRSFQLTTQPPSFLGVVILGISNDDFNVLTDFSNYFLAIEKFDGSIYVQTHQGVSMIQPEDGSLFRIRVQSVSEGPSS